MYVFRVDCVCCLLLMSSRVLLSQLWRDQVTSSEDVYSALANACAMAGPEGCKLAPFKGASGADVVKNISDTIEVRFVLSLMGYIPHPLRLNRRHVESSRTHTLLEASYVRYAVR